MTKQEREVAKEIIMEMAERCASTPDKGSRWTREDRVAIVYSALCSIYEVNDKTRKLN